MATDRNDRTARSNAIAQGITNAYGYLPIAVRWNAAAAADEVIQNWIDAVEEDKEAHA